MAFYAIHVVNIMLYILFQLVKHLKNNLIKSAMIRDSIKCTLNNDTEYNLYYIGKFVVVCEEGGGF